MDKYINKSNLIKVWAKIKALLTTKADLEDGAVKASQLKIPFNKKITIYGTVSGVDIITIVSLNEVKSVVYDTKAKKILGLGSDNKYYADWAVLKIGNVTYHRSKFCAMWGVPYSNCIYNLAILDNTPYYYNGTELVKWDESNNYLTLGTEAYQAFPGNEGEKLKENFAFPDALKNLIETDAKESLIKTSTLFDSDTMAVESNKDSVGLRFSPDTYKWNNDSKTFSSDILGDGYWYIPAATQTDAGVMSAADKKKVDSLGVPLGTINNNVSLSPSVPSVTMPFTTGATYLFIAFGGSTGVIEDVYLLIALEAIKITPVPIMSSGKLSFATNTKNVLTISASGLTASTTKTLRVNKLTLMNPV